MKLSEEHRREQMLSGVLLHVVESPFPVDLTVDLSPCGKLLAYEVPYRSLLILFHLFHGNFQRGRPQQAGIEGLTTTCRVESRAVQGNMPDGIAMAAYEFADVGHRSGERPEK